MSGLSPLHAHALAALEQADAALAHAPALCLAEPHLPEHITAESLTAMLGAHVAGARIDGTDLMDAHDGMTVRNKLGLRWNAAGRAARLPAQVFVKITPAQPYLRETLSMLHLAENEVRFYRELQPELPELAPRAYYARSYPGGRFIILMEVLEARGLKPYWQACDCPVEHARAVVTALAQLHARYWASDRFDSDLIWVRPRTQRFGFDWHQRSLNDARTKFLAADVCRTLPAALIELIRLYDANDRTLLAYWETLPATLLHGDSHLGNTFAHPDGRAGCFDWQVIYRGHGLREVAYFFLSAASPAMRRQHEREIVELYLDQLQANGVTLDRELAWRHYCLFALDALDANIKTTVRGGYGHAASALERARQTLTDSLLENGVPDLLRAVLRDGRL